MNSVRKNYIKKINKIYRINNKIHEIDGAGIAGIKTGIINDSGIKNSKSLAYLYDTVGTNLTYYVDEEDTFYVIQ